MGVLGFEPGLSGSRIHALTFHHVFFSSKKNVHKAGDFMNSLHPAVSCQYVQMNSYSPGAVRVQMEADTPPRYTPGDVLARHKTRDSTGSASWPALQHKHKGPSP